MIKQITLKYFFSLSQNSLQQHKIIQHYTQYIYLFTFPLYPLNSPGPMKLIGQERDGLHFYCNI